MEAQLDCQAACLTWTLTCFSGSSFFLATPARKCLLRVTGQHVTRLLVITVTSLGSDAC